MVASNAKQERDTKSKNDSLSYVDGVLGRTSAQLASSRQWATAKATDTLDKTISPAQRDALSQKAQTFIETNPRLAAFIATNVVLTGIPVLLFLLFSVSVFVFSLTTGLVLGGISALVFTATTVGLGLCVIFPTIFFTTIAAFLVFFWGLVGYTILRWAASTRRQGHTQLNGAALNGQVRSRIAESAEAAEEERSRQDNKSLAMSDHSESKAGNRQQISQSISSSTTPATALPNDRQTTVAVSTGKSGDHPHTIHVPDASTTGMVAS